MQLRLISGFQKPRQRIPHRLHGFQSPLKSESTEKIKKNIFTAANQHKHITEAEVTPEVTAPMATMTETKQESSSARIILQKRAKQQDFIDSLEDEKKKQQLRLQLIKDEIKDFKTFEAASNAFRGAATLTLIRLREKVKELASKRFTLNDLYKALGISGGNARKRVRKFKKDAEEAGLTDDEMIEKMEKDINKGVVLFGKKKLKLKTTAKWVMDPEIKTALEHDIEIAEEKADKDAAANERSKEREKDEREELILDLEIAIQLLKKRVQEKGDQKGYTLIDTIGKLSLKLIEKTEAGKEFDVSTPGTQEYKNGM